MRTAVDSNLLLDILLADRSHGPPAKEALAAALDDGQVVVCPVVYAEVAASFGDPREADGALGELEVQLDPFEPESLRETARVWRAYTRNRGQQVQCRVCGRQFDLRCPVCHQPTAWRQHVISDFLIGGHALVQADALLTRDRGYYRTYFPGLRLRVPTPSSSQ